MIRPLTILTALAAAVALAPAAFAQAASDTIDLALDSPWEEPVALPSEYAVPGTRQVSTLTLTLHDCLRLAQKNNLRNQKALLDRESAKNGITQASGVFDPVFSANSAFSKSRTDPSSVFAAKTNEDFTFDFGLSKRLALGTDVDLRISSKKNINDADPAFSLFTRSYNTSFSVSIVQDLLKDAGTIANEAEIRYAEIASTRSDVQAEAVAAEVTYSVIEAYWNLVLAREQLAIREKALEIAISLLADNERKLAVGLTAQPEVIQAKSNRAQEEDRVLLARNEVLRTEDILRVLVAGRIARTDAEHLSVWQTRLAPGAERLPDQIPLADEEQFYQLALTQAMESRPDLRIARLSVREAQMRMAVADNRREHTLKLTAAADTSGRDAALGKAIHEANSDKFLTWRVALAYSVPLGNSSAEAGYQLAIDAVERSKQDLAIAQIDAFREIRDAYRAYQTATQRIQTTRASVEYSDLVWRNELEKMRLGLTTTFQVSQMARDLAEAETARKQAEVDRILAFYRLQQARGKLTPWDADIAGN